MELLNFLKSIPTPILVLVVVLVAVVTLFMMYKYLKQSNLDKIRAQVYQLFLKAEHRFIGTEAGKQKLKWVVQQARGLLPKWLQFLVTEQDLTNIINKWFRAVKDLLDDGKMNGSSK